MKTRTLFSLVLLFCLTLAAQAAGPQSLTNGLIAYYPFNGNANDESGHGHHGVVIGTGTQLTTGVNGAPYSAYRGAPGTNHIQGSGINLSNSSLSITLFFKLEHTNGARHGVILSLGGEETTNSLYIAVRYAGSGFVFAFPGERDGFFVTGASVGYLHWSHIAVTFNTATRERRFYIDGSLIATNIAIQGFSGPDNFDFHPGGFGGDGFMDQVRFYDRVLSPEEIGQINLYERTPPPNSITNGLVAYYPFDGNANDESGHSNHATPGGNYQFVTNGLSGGALRTIGDNSIYYAGGGHAILPTFGTNMNGGFTLSLWARDEALGGHPFEQENYITYGFLGTPRAMITLIARLQKLEFNLDDDRPDADFMDIFKSIDLNTYPASWKSFILTYEPGKAVCYFNGEKLGEANGIINVFPVSHAALGRSWWDGGNSSSARMSALFDNVRIYNRALTEQEVQSLYDYERPPPQISFSNGLVAYFPFNGNANDETGNGNNGNPGTAQIAMDRFGMGQAAYFFNGVDSFITFSGPPTTNVENISMFCWLKPAALPQWGIALKLGYSDGDLPCNGFALGIGDATSATSLHGVRLLGENACVSWVDGGYSFQSTNDWHHVGFIRKSGEDRFFVDGQLVTVKSVATPNPPTQFAIGTHLGSDASNAVFNGFIDDVRLYDRAVTDEEVQSLYLYERNARPSLSISIKTIRLTMSVVAGRTYQLDSSADLMTWTPYGSQFTAQSSTTFQDVDVIDGKQFFRIRQIGP